MSAPAAAIHAPARFHRPELDALRFGAFFLVFLNHALPHASADYSDWGIPSALASILAATGRAGALGVDLFFALSSYLITELLLRERRATGSLNVRAFYTRRILRIWPLYFFALLVLAPAMALFDPRDSLPVSYAAGFALLSGNWVCAWAGYPASSFALLWSVSIEEQFYLAWPWLVRRVSIARCGLAMLALATLTRIVLAALHIEHPGVWCNTLARLDPIAGGALLAHALDGRVPSFSKWSRAAWLAGGAVALLGTGAVGVHAGWGAVATYPLAAVSALAILYATLGLGCANRSLLYLGKISFGLYVLHVAVLSLTEPAGPLAGLALTVVAAALSYRYLETPFLRLKERYALVGSRPL